jgi:nucleoside-diphosphate-sugar epimerase
VIDLRGRRIAIIGGAGFIGHNLALDLHAQGAAVDVIDSLQVNNLLWFAMGKGEKGNQARDMLMLNQRLDLLRGAGIPLHPQDARDYDALSRTLNELRPQVVIQLAAVAHAGRANKDPYSTFDHSLRTLENALDWARTRAERFVYFSSSMVYGNFRTASVSEDHPLEPIGIYGALKLAGEKMVIAYQQTFKLPYTIVRPSALYGPRCVSRRVVQVFIENARDGKPLRIDGDGNESVDFTYIDDLVQGIRLVVSSAKAENEILNLTYGASRTINELAAIVQREYPGTRIEYTPRDELRPFRGTLNVDKARALVGYAPANPIDVGVPCYAKWYEELDAEMRSKAT